MTTLSNHDFIIAIDAGHTKTRLQRAEESVIGLVSELAQVDNDGVDKRRA